MDECDEVCYSTNCNNQSEESMLDLTEIASQGSIYFNVLIGTD